MGPQGVCAPPEWPRIYAAPYDSTLTLTLPLPHTRPHMLALPLSLSHSHTLRRLAHPHPPPHPLTREAHRVEQGHLIKTVAKQGDALKAQQPHELAEQVQLLVRRDAWVGVRVRVRVRVWVCSGSGGRARSSFWSAEIPRVCVYVCVWGSLGFTQPATTATLQCAPPDCLWL